jgi:hypothetical protein
MQKAIETNNATKGMDLKNGKRHYDSNGNSLGGIKAKVINSDNQQIEVEMGEVIITRDAVSNPKKYKIEGTTKEILSTLNQEGGGVPINETEAEILAKYKTGGKIPREKQIYLGKEGGSNVSSKGAFEIAVDMENEGIDSETIRSITGWFINPFDKLWRYEISDENMEIIFDFDSEKLVELESFNNPKLAYKTPLKKVIIHNELFKAYPSIKDLEICFIFDKNSDVASLNVDSNNNVTININLYGNRFRVLPSLPRLNRGADFKAVITHELQHVIQVREGLSGGSSVKQEYKKLLSSLPTNEPTRMEVGSSREDFLWGLARRNYLNSLGEIESRDSQKRVYFDKKTRIEIPPYSLINFNNEEVIVIPETKIKFNEGGELIKRADGSYSKRGLWDNIRDNVGSGRKPTKQMLEQEAKIKEKYHLGGDMSKHLAPNGKPSKLTHEQWHLVRTPEFKAWFGFWEENALIDNFLSERSFIMADGMALSISNSKVLDSIITLIPIDVMDKFGGKEFAIDMLFHNVSMFINILTLSQGDSFVVPFMNESITFITITRAKLSNTQTTSSYTEVFLALNTLQDNLISVVNTLAFSSKFSAFYQISPFTLVRAKFFVGSSNPTLDAIYHSNVILDKDKEYYTTLQTNAINYSKVIDEKTKEPLVVYHGTDKQFNVFKKADKFREDWGIKDYGMYFTDSIYTAEYYSYERIDENKEYEEWNNKLNELKKKEDWDNWAKLYEYGKDKFKPNKAPINPKSVRIIECFLNIKKPFLIDGKGRRWFTVLKGAVDISINNKNDGIIALNTIEVSPDIQTTYVAFEPNQIKLADGTNTTFDVNNDDIRFAEGGSIPEQGTLYTKDKKTKLEYIKNGSDYEFIVYELEDSAYKRHNKNKAIMNYNQFIDYLYTESYLHDKFKEGGSIKPNFSKMSESEIKEFYDSPEGRKLDAKTYSEWKGLVNMSKSELEKFYNSVEGKKAGLTTSQAKEQGIDSGRESARWIIKMKDIPYKEWTSDMWRWAKKQINFIKRELGMRGSLYNDKGEKTRKHTALLIWGHNPETKFAEGGGVPKDAFEKSENERNEDYEGNWNLWIDTLLKNIDLPIEWTTGESRKELYGDSFYITIFNEDWQEFAKLRFSGHSVTNTSRLQNEFHNPNISRFYEIVSRAMNKKQQEENPEELIKFKGGGVISQKALAVETTDLKDYVRKYFVKDGRIDVSDAMQQMFGNKRGKSIADEYRKRIGLHKAGGLTISELAHKLWEEHKDEVRGGVEDSDFREAVEDVISSEYGVSSMIKSLMEKSDEGIEDEEAKYWANQFDENEYSSDDEQLTDEEMSMIFRDMEQAERELAKGTEHEMEHLATLKKVAEGKVTPEEAVVETSRTHIAENKNYYEDLAKMEKENEKYSKGLYFKDYMNWKKEKGDKPSFKDLGDGLYEYDEHINFRYNNLDKASFKFVTKNNDKFYYRDIEIEQPTEEQEESMGLEKRNIWIPNMTINKLKNLLSKSILTKDDVEDLKDFKYFLLTDKQSAVEKGFYKELIVNQKEKAYVLKDKFWLVNIDSKIKEFEQPTKEQEESIPELIEGLEILLESLEGEEKKDLEDTIEGLKLLL